MLLEYSTQNFTTQIIVWVYDAFDYFSKIRISSKRSTLYIHHLAECLLLPCGGFMSLLWLSKQIPTVLVANNRNYPISGELYQGHISSGSSKKNLLLSLLAFDDYRHSMALNGL